MLESAVGSANHQSGLSDGAPATVLQSDTPLYLIINAGTTYDIQDESC